MEDEYSGPIGSRPSYEQAKKLGLLVIDPSTFDWSTAVSTKPAEKIKPLVHDESKIFKDFLGSDIYVGDKALRIHSNSHYTQFKKCVITKIDRTRKHDSIGIITEGNEKIGYTYPERILVQQSISRLL